MLNYPLSFLTAFGITFFAIPSIIRVAEIKNLYDVPDERKHHARSVPTLGGMGIFAGLLFSLTFWTNQAQIVELQYIISALLILFFMGIKDDMVDLRAWKKLMGQIVAAAILVECANVRLTTFYGLFGVDDIPAWAGWVLTTFTCVVITNAFNLVDGIDCLAGSLGVVGCAAFGLWFYFLGMTQYTILCCALAGAVCAFLWFNRTPARVFMGDTGSMLIGFVMSLLAVKFIESVRVLPRDHAYKILSVPVFTCGILVVPLFDTLRVFTIRMLAGKSPFSPDRNHVHHLLVDLGLTHMRATAVLVVFTVLTIFTLFKLQGTPAELLLGGLVVIPTTLAAILSRARDRRRALQGARA